MASGKGACMVFAHFADDGTMHALVENCDDPVTIVANTALKQLHQLVLSKWMLKWGGLPLCGCLKKSVHLCIAQFQLVARLRYVNPVVLGLILYWVRGPSRVYTWNLLYFNSATLALNKVPTWNCLQMCFRSGLQLRSNSRYFNPKTKIPNWHSMITLPLKMM